jgi:hypothetical protein
MGSSPIVHPIFYSFVTTRLLQMLIRFSRQCLSVLLQKQRQRLSTFHEGTGFVGRRLVCQHGIVRFNFPLKSPDNPQCRFG